MKQLAFYLLFCFLICLSIFPLGDCQSESIKSRKLFNFEDGFRKNAWSIYKSCGLGDQLRFDIFCLALNGSRREIFKKNKIITIIDYTQPSTAKRCFVIDVKSRRLLYKTLVAHGLNTGANKARNFSNRKGAKTSSLGFYRTGNCYNGRHGYSLKLKGLEKKINHNAMERYIVMHKADYVSQEFIEQYGRLGRSWGCPALPVNVAKKIIDTIKGGSCLFIYADDPHYLSQTDFLQSKSSG